MSLTRKRGAVGGAHSSPVVSTGSLGWGAECWVPNPHHHGLSGNFYVCVRKSRRSVTGSMSFPGVRAHTGVKSTPPGVIIADSNISVRRCEFDSFIVLELTSSTNGGRGARVGMGLGVGAVCLSLQVSMKAFSVVLIHYVAVVCLINVFTREMDCLGTCTKWQWWGERRTALHRCPNLRSLQHSHCGCCACIPHLCISFTMIKAMPLDAILTATGEGCTASVSPAVMV